MSALVVCFSSCFNEKSGKSNVVLAVPGVSVNHCCDVGLCKLGHFDNVCSRMVQDLHVQHFSFAKVAELGVLRSFDVNEHHENVGEEHVVLERDLDLLSEVSSQAFHKAFDCIVIVLFVVRVTLLLQFEVAHFHAFGGEEWA